MDPTDPRNPLNRRLGDLPPDLRGQPPGLLGAPSREEYLRQHPSAVEGGPPKVQEPPPLPAGMPAAQVEDIARLYATVLRGILNDPYCENLIATRIIEWAKQAWRPVHLQPWAFASFRSVPLGGVSLWAGTTIPSGASTWTTVVSDQVPLGSYGTIKWVGHAAGLQSDWPNLFWRIVHGPTTSSLVPYRTPFNGWQHQIGQIEAPTEVNAILVPEGHIVALQANQNTGSEITGVMGLIRGWMWPRTGGVVDNVSGQIVA